MFVLVIFFGINAFQSLYGKISGKSHIEIQTKVVEK